MKKGKPNEDSLTAAKLFSGIKDVTEAMVEDYKAEQMLLDEKKQKRVADVPVVRRDR